MIKVENCINTLTKSSDIDGVSYMLDVNDLHITFRHNDLYNDWDVHIDDCDMDTVANIYHMKYIEQVLNIAKYIQLSYEDSRL